MRVKFVVFFFLQIFCCCFAAKENELVVHFRQFSQCPNVKDPTLRFKRLNLYYLGNDTYQMEGEIMSEKVLDGNLKYTLEIEKCTGDGNIDKCKHYLNYVVDDLCRDFKRPGSLTKPYFENTGIPAKCPILPGNYTMNPQKVGIDGMAKTVVSSGKFWKLHTKIISKNNGDEKVEFCFFCEGEVLKQESKTRQRDFTKAKIAHAK